MRGSTLFFAAAIVAVIPTTASAMSRDGARLSSDARATVADPDERIERMAAASTPNDTDRSKPRKSARNMLKDDPYLREAFGWLDNK